MTDKVIRLVSSPTPETKVPDPVVIARLEEALAKAKAGNACGMAVVVLLDDGGVLSSWHRGEGAGAFTLLGALDVLKDRFRRGEIA